jgi:hypothetical protein
MRHRVSINHTGHRLGEGHRRTAGGQRWRAATAAATRPEVKHANPTVSAAAGHQTWARCAGGVQQCRQQRRDVIRGQVVREGEGG